MYMKLVYKNKEIEVTQTHNQEIMKYKFPKLRYAIILYDCNSYSSVGSKQRVDIVLVDDKFHIVKIRYAMHENTIQTDTRASHTIILPLDTFDDLEIGTKFSLKY